MSQQPIKVNDLDAAQQLQARIDEAETLQKRMSEANAAIRKHKKAGADAQVRALVDLGFTEQRAYSLLTPDFAGRIGFPAFELSNNNANIRRMKARIEHVEAVASAKAEEIEGTNARYEDAPAANRVRLFYVGKPAESVRAVLKRHGFRWTPTLGCWQAFRNASSLAKAREMAGIVETVAAGAGTLVVNPVLEGGMLVEDAARVARASVPVTPTNVHDGPCWNVDDSVPTFCDNCELRRRVSYENANRVIRPTVTLAAREISRYMQLKAEGYTTLWTGEGKICLEAPEANADATQPYQVRTGCGHIVTRQMRPSTAGVPYTPETVIEAPNGRPCPTCEADAADKGVAV
jgi:hypothetical protein